MDSLRAGAMLLGVLLHAAVSFIANDVPWAVQDRNRHLLFDVFFLWVHGFRMQLFFVVAGFFGRLLYLRLGPRTFARRRAERILLPFIGGMVLIVPWVIVLFAYGSMGSWEPAFRYLWSGHFVGRIGMAHLWFLCYLLVFYAVALAAAPLGEKWRRAAAGKWEGLRGWNARYFPLIFWAPTMAVLSFAPLYWTDVEEPGVSLLPTPAGLCYYGLFFLAGWMMQGEEGSLERLSARFWRYLAAAAVCFAAVLALLPNYKEFQHPHFEWLRVGCTAAYALYTWCMICGVIGFCARHLNRPRAAFRYLAEAAYWIYLAHVPVVIWLQIVLAEKPWPSLIKFALINLITVGLLLCVYQFGIRRTWVGVMLNGKRIGVEK